MRHQIVIKRVRLSGAGVTEVPKSEREHSKRATHLSLFEVQEGSPARWLEDHTINETNYNQTYTHVMVRAAKYSMELQLPIAAFEA